MIRVFRSAVIWLATLLCVVALGWYGWESIQERNQHTRARMVMMSFGLWAHNYNDRYDGFPSRDACMEMDQKLCTELEKYCKVYWTSFPIPWTAFKESGEPSDQWLLAFEEGADESGGYVLFVDGAVERRPSAVIRKLLAAATVRAQGRSTPKPAQVDNDSGDSKNNLSTLLDNARNNAAAQARRRAPAEVPELDPWSRRIPGSAESSEASNSRYVNMTRDGRWLFTALEDGVIRVWDLSREDPLEKSWELEVPQDFRILSRGDHLQRLLEKRLIVANDDGSMLTWQMTDHPESWVSTELKGHQSKVLAADCTEDGESIVSGDIDGVVRIWTVTTQESPSSEVSGNLSVPVRFCSLVNSLDCIVAGNVTDPIEDCRLKVWRRDTFSGTRTESSLAGTDFWRVSQSTDGRWFGSTSMHGEATLWDLTAEDIALSRLVLGKGHSWQNLLIGENGSTIGMCKCAGMEMWSSADGDSERITTSLQGHGQSSEPMHFVPPLVFSPDGRWLAAPSFDEHLNIWSMESAGENAGAEVVPLATLAGHQATLRAISFSGDSRLIASVDMHGRLQIWQTESFTDGNIQPVYSGFAEAAALSNVIVSPDGRWLVTGNWPVTTSLITRPGDPEPTFDVRLWRLDPQGQPVDF